MSRQQKQFVDPAQAMEDLLARWQANDVTSRRERTLAIRLATQQPQHPLDSDTTTIGGHETASIPGVIDFLQHRSRRPSQPLPDDLDVFERYYAEHPDEAELAVFDE